MQRLERWIAGVWRWMFLVDSTNSSSKTAGCVHVTMFKIYTFPQYRKFIVKGLHLFSKLGRESSAYIDTTHVHTHSGYTPTPTCKCSQNLSPAPSEMYANVVKVGHNTHGHIDIGLLSWIVSVKMLQHANIKAVRTGEGSTMMTN